MAQDLPTLVYDGECGICRYWVTYWQDLTEDSVIYRVYQEAATDYPHQPRLDWQMWFAALGGARDNPWIIMLTWRLLEGSPSVLALLESNPFADSPPTYVRAQLYDYRFADRQTHILTGQWWVRRSEGLYFPQVSAADFTRAPERAPSL
jgi:hypothetical protein